MGRSFFGGGGRILFAHSKSRLLKEDDASYGLSAGWTKQVRCIFLYFPSVFIGTWRRLAIQGMCEMTSFVYHQPNGGYDACKEMHEYKAELTVISNSIGAIREVGRQRVIAVNVFHFFFRSFFFLLSPKSKSGESKDPFTTRSTPID